MPFFSKPIQFGCNQCGECCRQMRVPVNHLDIIRIQAARPEQQPEEWLQVYPVDEKEQSAAWICGQPSILILKVNLTENACVFLDDNACGLYDDRPGVCRIWPFESNGRKIHISPPHRLLTSLTCEQTPFHGEKDIRQSMTASDAAHKAYRNYVQQWNSEHRAYPERQSLERFLNFLMKLSEGSETRVKNR